MIVRAHEKQVARPSAPALPAEIGPLAETCQSLLAQLGLTGGSPAGAQAVGIAGSAAGEGTTTIAVNLAVAAARLGGLRVALVEASVDRPVAARAFSLPRGPGFFDVMSERAELDDALQPISGIQLWVLPAGQESNGVVASPPWNALADILAELKNRFDLIVFDLPNAQRPARLLPLAGQLDGVLLVVEAERTRWETALGAKELLLQARARLLGVVLNKRRDRVPAWLDRAL